MLHQKEFLEFHKRKYMALKKRSTQSKTYLENREKKDTAAKEKLERERLIFLKKNDIGGYMKMLEDTKETRLMEFMQQTNSFLKEIEEKVKIQKEVISTILKNQDNADGVIKEDEEDASDKDVEQGQEDIGNYQ